MKIKLLFALVAIMMLNKSVSAQQSIIPDISIQYLDKLIAIAKANYPRVKGNQNRINAAQADVGKAGVSYLDAFTVSYIYQPKVSTVIAGQTVQSQFNGFQAGVFFNLGTFLEKPFIVREAKQAVLIADEEQNEYLLTLTNDVKKRYYTYVQTVANLKLITQTTLDEQSLAADIKHKFEKGEETYDNYNRSQSALTTSYQSKIAAETNALIAKADLEELLGEKLEDIK